MRISCIDVDSKIPNLALMKISAYHKSKGDTVGLNLESPNKTYISCIFKDSSIPNITNSDVGGTGYDINKKLPDYIEFLKPDYDLYPSSYSQGFTTRGCIRTCPFCVVPKKEGNIKIWQHPSEFHDDRFNTIMLMDNNWLANKDWFIETSSWIIDNKLKIIEHGVDIRLLDDERADQIRHLKFAKPLKFAWDNIGDEKFIVRGIELLAQHNFPIRSKSLCYVLVGFNTSFEQDLYRCERLKELGVTPYVMRYVKTPKLNRLARWCNLPMIFWKSSFNEYDLANYKRRLDYTEY
jgi:hypothetical protein